MFRQTGSRQSESFFDSFVCFLFRHCSKFLSTLSNYMQTYIGQKPIRNGILPALWKDKRGGKNDQQLGISRIR
jgi:hypothetical protein